MYIAARAVGASLVPFFISNCSYTSSGTETKCYYFVAGNDNASATTDLTSYVDGSSFGPCDFSLPTQICSSTPLRGAVKGTNTTWTLSNENEAMCLPYVVGSANNSSQPILSVVGGKTGQITHFESGTSEAISGIGSSSNTSCSTANTGNGSSSSSSSSTGGNKSAAGSSLLQLGGVTQTVMVASLLFGATALVVL